ncbi:MAG: hypothetical protein QXK06_05505 [Candidatus Diapherotrites archaeon]
MRKKSRDKGISMFRQENSTKPNESRTTTKNKKFKRTEKLVPKNIISSVYLLSRMTPNRTEEIKRMDAVNRITFKPQIAKKRTSKQNKIIAEREPIEETRSVFSKSITTSLLLFIVFFTV